MNEYNNTPPTVHRVELDGRERLTILGVEDVERFDETGIVLSTSAGVLTVTGEDLHIGKLSLDGGELHGGNLFAESKPGKGTKITLSIPLRRSGTAAVQDIPFDYSGGFNRTLLALSDALPRDAFLQQNQD